MTQQTQYPTHPPEPLSAGEGGGRRLVLPRSHCKQCPKTPVFQLFVGIVNMSIWSMAFVVHMANNCPTCQAYGLLHLICSAGQQPRP